MNLFAAGMLVSILVYLVVGNYAGRRVKKLEDYFVAGRQAPTLLIVGTLVASLMSTNAFMGESGLSYSGFPAVIITLTAINIIGYVAGGLYFGRFLRRSRALTLAERWANAGFVRIHRSYLVQLRLVTELRLTGSGYVVAVDGVELPVSRRHTRELKDRLIRAAKHDWTR